MSLPPDLDAHLVARVSTAAAANYLGRTTAWVRKEIRAGRIAAIDTGGGRRACWSISVRELRRVVARAEARAELRRRSPSEANRTNRANPVPETSPPPSALPPRK